MFTETVRQIFPNSIIVDAALEYPITDKGWNITLPGEGICRFNEPDFRLVFNLQDMLTTKASDYLDIPVELIKIRNFYKDWADMNRIIVVVWPLNVVDVWPDNEFHIIEFSTHQYETWKSYKAAEDVLREAFSYEAKDYEFNFLCMNRISKPHRKILHSKLSKLTVGNVSLQCNGHELRYPGLDYKVYNDCYDNLSNLLSLKQNFNTSMFSVVTESQYHERFGIITEKTFNAIVAGHPFLVAGHQGCLDDIKSLGFKTWNSIFDEEYQYAKNSLRLDMMLNSNAGYFTKITSADLKDLVNENRDTIDYNKDYFFNDFGPDRLDYFRAQLLSIWE